MTSAREEVMEILEAYDLVGTYRAAANLVGCDYRVLPIGAQIVPV